MIKNYKDYEIFADSYTDLLTVLDDIIVYQLKLMGVGEKSKTYQLNAIFLEKKNISIFIALNIMSNDEIHLEFPADVLYTENWKDIIKEKHKDNVSLQYKKTVIENNIKDFYIKFIPVFYLLMLDKLDYELG